MADPIWEFGPTSELAPRLAAGRQLRSTTLNNTMGRPGVGSDSMRFDRGSGVGALIVSHNGALLTESLAATTEQISVGRGAYRRTATRRGRWDTKAAVAALSEGARFVAFVSGCIQSRRPATPTMVGRVPARPERNTTEAHQRVEQRQARQRPELGVAMTPDARFIAFNSHASNLVAGDTNEFGDIFVRDRQTKTTSRVASVQRARKATGMSRRSRRSLTTAGTSPLLLVRPRFVGDESGFDDVHFEFHDRRRA